MTDVDLVFRDLFDGLEKLRCEYLVGGSLATSAFGHPRQTNDIDIVLDLPGARIDDAVAIFGAKFMVSELEIQDAVLSRQPYSSFQLLHLDCFLKVDVFIKQQDHFQESSFQRRRRIRFIGDVEAWFCTPEDSVLQKIRWYELGNRSSDRQWNDLVQVIEVQGEAFNRVYFREWADKLEIRELAEEALAEAWD
ncbi:MAG: hypothetical protein ACHQ50_12130 [Fimbriimonadales bacterium]